MIRNIGNITVTTYLDTRRKNVVKIRVQYRGASRYYTTRERLTDEEYRRFLRGTYRNPQIEDVFVRMVRNIEYLNNAEEFSFIRLKALMNIGRDNSLQALISNKVADLLQDRKLSTAQIYTDLLSSINSFVNDEITPISDVNSDYIKRYMDYLVREKNNGRTTVSIRMRSLSHILNTAVNDFLLKRNPIENIRIPRAERRQMNLSEKSLTKLMKATESEVGATSFYWLQFWRLQYYCNGLNLVDLLHLKMENISATSGEIKFVRRKTESSYGAMIYIPLIPEISQAFHIIGYGKNYIIPLLDNYEESSEDERRVIQNITRNINTHLKKICSKLEISEKITTYTARHTFATRLLRSGVPIEFISESLGHSNIRTTQNYLEGYTPAQRRDIANFLKVK